MDQQALSALGRHLQQLRTERGISLSQLAVNAGIAKSNLSRLEQGQGNPTLNTIWRLAVQLDLPFSKLIAPVSNRINEDGIEILLVEQGDDSPKVDAYWMSMAPHTSRLAEPHTQGATESVTLISGTLKVGPRHQERQLNAGETYTFAADEAHSYCTEAKEASFLIAITYWDNA
ncbi:helix-turn-helix domain-containing protein [Alteromonas gilva]|uniref:Helix-turn-helix domain-containing protein n=1 Tax=Alteromonas gilva TaxID=2987522 RepID=A0ABT5L2Q5_9ALTE|nr:helix-turn-helix transcriptional regulator [Alteromonas gilva]MDC8831334.1 helix-turn-helix domain-containing protein [Alteromonas gilva]